MKDYESLLNDAVSIISSLMEWRPDDMTGEEIADSCSEWDEARAFLNKMKEH